MKALDLHKALGVNTGYILESSMDLLKILMPSLCSKSMRLEALPR
jgi:hypothetical protein